MEAAEDPAFLDAMRRANIKGALVGVEAVTPEGLKDVYKGFNEVGEALVQRLVITSYSIHYTKLYESSPSPCRLPRSRSVPST